MRLRDYVLTMVCCAAACGTAFAQAPQAAGSKQPATSKQNAATTAAQAKPKSAPPAAAAPDAPQTADASKPLLTLNPHQVLTNDDLQRLGRQEGGMSVVGGSVDLSGIYDCDMNCYSQVRESAQIYPGNNLDWMRQLHDGIEKLKNDREWRAVLVHLGEIRSDYCTVADQEQSALAQADNFNNVTSEQINIREEYNRKLQALNQETTATYARMPPLQAKHPKLVAEFMSMQATRVMQLSCGGSGSRSYPDTTDPND
jgi:hypothetical protein